MANTRRTRTQHARSGDRWLTIAGYTGLGLGCLMLLIATFIVLVSPVDMVRDQLVRDVKQHTGRDLVVAGPASLMLFPRLGVSFGSISLSPPPGMQGEPTLQVESLEAELSLLSFLTHDGGVKRVTLSRPIVNLVVDAQGRRSWDFAAAGGSARLAQAGTRTDAPRVRRATKDEELAAALERIVPMDVRIANGTVRYRDERTRLGYEVTGLDIDLALNRVDVPLELKGNLTWQAEKLAFDGILSTPRSALLEQRARLAGKLWGRPMEASYDGTVSLAGEGSLNGLLSLKAPSILTLGNWIGRPMTAGEDPGPLSLSASLSSGNDQISLSRLTATVGGASIDGSLEIATKGERPRLTGDLRVSELDFGRLLMHQGPASAPRAPGPAPSRRLSEPLGGDATRGGDAPPAAAQVRSPAGRDGAGSDWSDDAIDFALLGLADAELTLSADRIINKDVKIGPSRLAVKIDNKVARITLQDMQLYDGRGRGTLTLDGSGQVPVMGANFAYEGVSAQPFLRDAMGFDWLEGRSTITVALAGQGATERQMIETLNGKVDMMTTSGAIAGVDVDKFLRNLEQGRLDFSTSPAEKTPFSEFAASYTIANGVAQNNDLRLVSPRLRVTGQGTVDLPRRQLDYTVNPKIAGGVSISGVVNLKNVEIPIRIAGSWDNPTFSIKGQDQILETVREIGKNIKQKDVDDALKSLFGTGDGQRPKPRDLIERFLKKQ
jgi:AsmA protein